MEMERKNKGKKSMKEGRKDEKQRGVCYLGRIPPRMDPSTLRQMLSQYGEIQRWVEFSDKRVAKRVANMLNGEQIGGKKRSSFYYDLWNIKYLSKFKWDNLTEEIVEKSRALSAIDERLKKRQRAEEDSGSNPDLSDSQLEHQVIHRFCQKKPVANNAAKTKSRLSGDVLSATGQVIGDLWFDEADNNEVGCDRGIQIPDDVEHIKNTRTQKAKFSLLVEKYSVFDILKKTLLSSTSSNHKSPIT
ncbi:hypothetical protein ACFX2A_045879 [Malus domestica]